jgi:anti-sigma regulatory factor (Ser/Thr protein kinase)
MAARTDLRMELAPSARSAGEARNAVAHALPDQVAEDKRDAVALLVSELVTNAILHVGAAIQLDVHGKTPGTVRVDVRDASPFGPRQREAGLSTSGRGLALLEALSDRWGVDVSRGGKSVWFELDLPAKRS